jgi:hypothetical protein
MVLAPTVEVQQILEEEAAVVHVEHRGIVLGVHVQLERLLLVVSTQRFEHGAKHVKLKPMDECL